MKQVSNLLSVPVCYQSDFNVLIIRILNFIDCMILKVLNALLALRKTPTVKFVDFLVFSVVRICQFKFWLKSHGNA